MPTGPIIEHDARGSGYGSSILNQQSGKQPYLTMDHCVHLVIVK